MVVQETGVLYSKKRDGMNVLKGDSLSVHGHLTVMVSQGAAEQCV